MEEIVDKIKAEAAFVVKPHPKKPAITKSFSGQQLLDWLATHLKLTGPPAVDYITSLVGADLIEPCSSKAKSKSFKPETLFKFVDRSVVVIVGGGYAGSRLSKQLTTNARVKLVYVDTKPYFESTPEVLRTFVETSIESSVALSQKISVPHKDYLGRGEFIEGKAVDIIPESKKLVLDTATLDYDYLVIATGSSYRSNIKMPYVPKNKRTDDYRARSRSEIFGDTATKIKLAQHILIVGGGVVGIELSAEIICKYPNKKVTLVHRQPRLVEKMSKKVSAFCQSFLSSRGITLILSEEVRELTAEETKPGPMQTYTLLPSKTEIDADLIFYCTGTTPNSDFMKQRLPEYLDVKGLIKTNDYFQLTKYPNIFAIGDVTAWREEKMVDRAIVHSMHVASHISQLIQGKPFQMPAYTPPSKPAMLVISLGPKHGAITSGGKLIFSNFLSSMIKEYTFRLSVNSLASKRSKESKKAYESVKPNKNLPRVLVVGSGSDVGRSLSLMLASHLFPIRADFLSGTAPDALLKGAFIEMVEVDYSRPFTLGLALKQVDTLVLAMDFTKSSEDANAWIEALKGRDHTVSHVIKLMPFSLPVPPHEGSKLTELEKLHKSIETNLEKYSQDHHSVNHTIFHYALTQEYFSRMHARETAASLKLRIPKGGQHWLSAADLSECVLATIYHPRKHKGKTHTIVGPEYLSGQRLAKVLSSSKLSDPIEFEAIPASESKVFFESHRYPATIAGKLAEYLVASHAPGTKTYWKKQKNLHSSVTELLGSAADLTTMQGWVENNYHLFIRHSKAK